MDQILQIISRLNDKINDNSPDSVTKFIGTVGSFVVFTSDSYSYNIKFLDITIFDSSCEEEDEDIENGDYAHFESVLTQRIQDILNMLSSVKLEKGVQF